MKASYVKFAKIFSIALLFGAVAAKADCSGGDLQTCSDYTEQIISVLVKGVDQCFNPSHASDNQQAKSDFQALGVRIQGYTADGESGDPARIQSAITGLQSDLASFAKQTSFPTSVYCKTQRECLEKGFEGNSKYPQCLPVNGDNHKNVQYMSFEYLVDGSLPSLVSILKKMQN